jgi:hypothetical protein
MGVTADQRKFVGRPTATSDGWTTLQSTARIAPELFLSVPDGSWTTCTLTYYLAGLESPVASLWGLSEVEQWVTTCRIHHAVFGPSGKVSAMLAKELLAREAALLLTPASRATAKLRISDDSNASLRLAEFDDD